MALHFAKILSLIQSYALFLPVPRVPCSILSLASHSPGNADLSNEAAGVSNDGAKSENADIAASGKRRAPSDLPQPAERYLMYFSPITNHISPFPAIPAFRRSKRASDNSQSPSLIHSGDNRSTLGVSNPGTHRGSGRGH